MFLKFSSEESNVYWTRKSPNNQPSSNRFISIESQVLWRCWDFQSEIDQIKTDLRTDFFARSIESTSFWPQKIYQRIDRNQNFILNSALKSAFSK